MNTHLPPSETGWRGSADIWLEAAYDTLLNSGVDAVRIMPLAKQLKLSRTSFYWFFKDREALLEALIERWRQKNTGNLIAQTHAFAASITEAALNLFDCWIDSALFDDRFEFAIRNWALQSDEVASEIADADRLRLTALKTMFERYGFADAEADIRARTIYLTQIGYISMRTEESLAIRMARIARYVEVFTGQPPGPAELERFFHRHRFQPSDDLAG
ncbi:TetR/AcrR family transcriptional regulator [Nitrincola sp. MINF-07-Sa-05]|uniref:TetR/AcrR family transcriptional regulator n=1 Tax=Nitrincola salilacus TaxID=3400273 RepID=UPI0039181BFE